MRAIRFSSSTGRSKRYLLLLIICGLVCLNVSARGGVNADGTETPDAKPAPSPTAIADTGGDETEYKNWIEVGIGGLSTSGDAAQFKQEHRISGDVFGGIQDMHYEHSVGEKATFSVDGHAIWDNNDYDIKLDLSQPDVGYIRGGFNEFRSWYDGDGGFFPPHGGKWFGPPISEMHIDRGEGWVEFGLRVPDWPEITVHFSREFREGQKDSTIWGDTGLTGLAVNPTRKIVPAFSDIDETRDIFAIDAMKTFGNTDIDLGMRWEHNENNDRLEMERNPDQFTIPPPANAPGAQRFITQHEDDNLDMFSGHVLSETRFSDSLWFTSGYSYTTLGSDLSGTRIFGTDFNSMFGAPILTLQSNDQGFLNLAGTSEAEEHVFNANVFWIPLKDLDALLGFRYTHEATDSDSTFLNTNTAANVAPFSATNPKGGFHLIAPVPRSADTSDNLNNLAERLELRYKHIENWLFYAEGEWEEEFGDVHEHEVINGVDQGRLNEDTNLLGQKYTVGATWYPLARLNLAAQYYYKSADYDNDFHSDVASPPVSGAERNQRLIGQDWTTNDANVRITVRPKVPDWLGSLSLVTRYDFMQSDISGKWSVSPAGTGPPPTGTILNEEWTGLITSHVITESLTWSPWTRLYLQESVSYTLNQTETPAGKIDLIEVGGVATGPVYPSPSVPNFRNDYWTVTSDAGFVLDDKTDVHADYTFYRANDYFKYSMVGLPFGMGATEHTVSAGLSRQITKQVRLSIKYSYFNYTDETFGGHNNYEAHSVFSSLQYRF